MRSPTHQAGFNLIEVLIALLLLGLVISISVETSMGDIALYKRNQDGALARWVALNRIAEVQLQGGYPSEGSEKGEMLMGHSRWQWQQEIVTTPDVDLRKVKVSVFREGQATQVLAVELAYVANPQPKRRSGL